MQIVLAGALPPSAVAGRLADPLLEAAPTLTAWFRRARVKRMATSTRRDLCTAWESWLLRQCGFEASTGQAASAGLGPVLAPDANRQQPVWLVELVHFSPSRDGAVLIPAQKLKITQQQSVALFESCRQALAGLDFQLQPHSPTHWRIFLPEGMNPPCPSPALVSMGNLNDWWSRDSSGRPWRRLLTELQMLWFDHAVNHARQAQDLPPINAVWLLGGARTAQLARPASEVLANTHIEHGLQAAVLAQDWAAWLAGMAELEQNLFAPQARTAPRIVMTGEDTILHIHPQTNLWARLRPASAQTWRKWWSDPS